MTEKKEDNPELTPVTAVASAPLKHYRTFGKMLKGRRRLGPDEKSAVEFARAVIAPLILDDD